VVVQGLDGGPRIPVNGLVDSGADKSVLPLEYAPLLGYGDEDLEPQEIDQVEGFASGRDARRPCMAHVRGRPRVAFEMSPLFVATLDALWGRADLMAAYEVTISERRQRLGLRRR
jgi:hypothetical protein